ncbi:hypothetical protein ACOME3_009357 [Neoechinorhynchus agilis]
MEFLSKVKGFFNSSVITTSSQLSPQTPRKISQRLILPSSLCCNIDPDTRWKLIRELGGGSEAKVYQAKAVLPNLCEAAAKIIHVQDDEIDQLPSYLNEVGILEKCEHQNIMRVLECYFYSNRIWIIEEYCEVGAIDSIICLLKRGLTETEIKCIAKQTLAALEYIHSNRVQIIHRDLKAANLMLNLKGLIKLGDFGVAAAESFLNTGDLNSTSNAQGGKNAKLTRYSFIGSPYWMAPEVIVCETDKSIGYSFPVDIWSFGITLIELAEMNPPHHVMNQNRVLIRILKHEAPGLIRSEMYSQSFKDFLRCILQKDPSKRLTAQQLSSHEFVQYSSDNVVSLKELLSVQVVSVETQSPKLKYPDGSSRGHYDHKKYWKSKREVLDSNKNEWAESSDESVDESNATSTSESLNEFSFTRQDPEIGGFMRSTDKLSPNSKMCMMLMYLISGAIDAKGSLYDRSYQRTFCDSGKLPELQSQYKPPETYIVERTAFPSHMPIAHDPGKQSDRISCLNSVCTFLSWEIIDDNLCGNSPGATSIPEVVFSVLNELADPCTDTSTTSTGNNSGCSSHNFSPPSSLMIQQHQLENASSMSSFKGQCYSPTFTRENDNHDILNACTSSGVQILLRREEGRHFRRQYQQQTQRLDHIKTKQTNEIRNHDRNAQTSRNALVCKLNEAANALHQEQRQEMQRAEQQVTSELKLESKRKRNEMERQQKHFTSSSSGIGTNERSIDEYLDNLKAYHMARLANLDNSFTKRRHQLKKDQLECNDS